MLGKGSVYAEECKRDGFIGVDFGIDQDLAGKLPDEWRVFNKQFIPIYLQKYPSKKKVAAEARAPKKSRPSRTSMLSVAGRLSTRAGPLSSSIHTRPIAAIHQTWADANCTALCRRARADIPMV